MLPPKYVNAKGKKISGCNDIACHSQFETLKLIEDNLLYLIKQVIPLICFR
jgi:hypothetical protein